MRRFERPSSKARKSRSHCRKPPVKKAMMKPVNWWDRLSVAKKPKIDPNDIFQTFSWWDDETDYSCEHACVHEMAGHMPIKKTTHLDRLCKSRNTSTTASVLTPDGNSIRPFESWRHCRARQDHVTPRRGTTSSQRLIEPLVPSPRKNTERMDCADVTNPAKDAVRTASATESVGEHTDCTEDTEDKIYRTFSWWDTKHGHRGDCPADDSLSTVRPRSQSLTSHRSPRAGISDDACKRRERSLSPLVSRYLDVPPPGELNRIFRTFSWWNNQEVPRKPLEKTIPPYKLKRRVSFDLKNNKKYPNTRISGAGDITRSRPRLRFGPQKDMCGRPIKPPNFCRGVKVPTTQKPKPPGAPAKPGVKERTLHNQWTKMKKVVPAKTSKSEDTTSVTSPPESQSPKIRPGSPVKGRTPSPTKPPDSAPRGGPVRSPKKTIPKSQVKRTSSEPSVKDFTDSRTESQTGQSTYDESDYTGTDTGQGSSDNTDAFATDTGGKPGSDGFSLKSQPPYRVQRYGPDTIFDGRGSPEGSRSPGGMRSPGGSGSSKGRASSGGSVKSDGPESQESPGASVGTGPWLPTSLRSSGSSSPQPGLYNDKPSSGETVTAGGPGPQGGLVNTSSRGSFGSYEEATSQGGTGAYEVRPSSSGGRAKSGQGSPGGAPSKGGSESSVGRPASSGGRASSRGSASPGSPGVLVAIGGAGSRGSLGSYDGTGSREGLDPYGGIGLHQGGSGSPARRESNHGGPDVQSPTGGGGISILTDGHHMPHMPEIGMPQVHLPHTGLSRLTLPSFGTFSGLRISGKTLLKVAAFLLFVGYTSLAFWDDIEEALGVPPEDPCGRVKDMHLCF